MTMSDSPTTAGGMRDDDLLKADRAYRRAAERAETLREARNALVRQALSEGWTHAKIAEVTGLSRGRISQLRDE